MFDDRPAILENRSIRRAWPPAWLLSIPRDTPVAGRPVVNASLALNYAFGGLEVRGYRALNLAVHVGCALLLFGLVRRTLLALGGEWRQAAGGVALAVASLWVVHPLTSECVAYVTQRSESIVAFAYLLVLYALARTATAQGERERLGFGALAIVAAALGMASKEVMVTAPVVALLYDASYHAGSVPEALRRRRALYAGLAASWLVLAALLAAGPRSGSVGFDEGVTPFTYLGNQGLMLSAYLQRVVWPDPLVLDYGWPLPRPWTRVLPHLLLWASVSAAALVGFWRRPRIGFPALAALLVLAPSSSVVPIATEVGAERRMYLPLAALLVLGVLAARALWLRAGLPPRVARPFAVVAVGVAVASLAALTRARNQDYQSRERLWRTVVAARPDNPRGHLNLGQALREQGRASEAEARFRAALALYPGYARAEAHLALLALDRGDLPGAELHLRRSLELDPRHGDVRNNLGELLARTGRDAEAVAEWREALARDPGLAYAANNLAWTLATHADPAFRDASEAVRLGERGAALTVYADPAVLDTLAAAYAEAGRFDAAERTAQRAAALADAAAEPRLASDIRARRALYATGRPFRQPVRAR